MSRKTAVARKVPQWACDLERKTGFERVVTLMTASNLLRDVARKEKKVLMREGGWKVEFEPRYPWRKDAHRDTVEIWIAPDDERRYRCFDMAWHRFARALRKKGGASCLGCVGEVLGITAEHSCSRPKKSR